MFWMQGDPIHMYILLYMIPTRPDSRGARNHTRELRRWEPGLSWQQTGQPAVPSKGRKSNTPPGTHCPPPLHIPGKAVLPSASTRWLTPRWPRPHCPSQPSAALHLKRWPRSRNPLARHNDRGHAASTFTCRWLNAWDGEEVLRFFKRWALNGPWPCWHYELWLSPSMALAIGLCLGHAACHPSGPAHLPIYSSNITFTH